MTTIQETGVYAVPTMTQHLGMVERLYDPEIKPPAAPPAGEIIPLRAAGILIDIKVVCGTIPDGLDIIVFRRDLVTCDWCLRDEANG